MAHNRVAMEMLLGTSPALRTTTAAPFTQWTRLRARILAGRLDGEIERGTTVHPGTTLAAHAARITSFDEREALARSLRSLGRQAREHRISLGFRIPVDRDAILACADLIEEVALRLHAPLPVHARGMARLRLLLSDGAGPMYGPGRGSLAAQLRGVLAAF